MKQLDNSLALVTGAAGGLGRALARQLGRHGCRVALTDLDPEGVATAASALRDEGLDAHAYPLDVTDPTALEALREQIHRELGAVQVVINNAGVVFGGPFLDVPLERHLTTYRVNVEGVVATTHVFLPDLLVAREGHLVNVASASGFIGLPQGSTYASSKWAVIGFSESIRQELNKQGHDHVGVTTVCPSYVDTGMFEGVKPPRLTRLLDPDELAAKVVTAIERRQPFLLEPWIVKLTPFLAHALPRPVAERLADLFGASTSMNTWTGHGRAAARND